jgi:hypothetical protein
MAPRKSWPPNDRATAPTRASLLASANLLCKALSHVQRGGGEACAVEPAQIRSRRRHMYETHVEN